jgi:hypothetical protein
MSNGWRRFGWSAKAATFLIAAAVTAFGLPRGASCEVTAAEAVDALAPENDRLAKLERRIEQLEAELEQLRKTASADSGRFDPEALIGDGSPDGVQPRGWTDPRQLLRVEPLAPAAGLQLPPAMQITPEMQLPPGVQPPLGRPVMPAWQVDPPATPLTPQPPEQEFNGVKFRIRLLGTSAMFLAPLAEPIAGQQTSPPGRTSSTLSTRWMPLASGSEASPATASIDLEGTENPIIPAVFDDHMFLAFDEQLPWIVR